MKHFVSLLSVAFLATMFVAGCSEPKSDAPDSKSGGSSSTSGGGSPDPTKATGTDGSAPK